MNPGILSNKDFNKNYIYLFPQKEGITGHSAPWRAAQGLLLGRLPERHSGNIDAGRLLCQRRQAHLP